MDDSIVGARILEKIPDMVTRKLLYCVSKAISDDATHYLAEFKPATINGIPLCVGDWINSNIDKEFDKKIVGANFDIFEFKRRSWKGRLVVDHSQKMLYSVINEVSLKRLRSDRKRNQPHYSQTLSAVLNKKYTAPIRGQYSMFDTNPEIFEDILVEYEFHQMAAGQLDKLENYTYCTLSFSKDSRRLVAAKLAILDKHLNEVSCKPLDITPNFVDLTSIDYSSKSDKSQDVEKPSLVTLKKKLKTSSDDSIILPEVHPLSTETENVPIGIREYKKQA